MSFGEFQIPEVRITYLESRLNELHAANLILQSALTREKEKAKAMADFAHRIERFVMGDAELTHRWMDFNTKLIGR